MHRFSSINIMHVYLFFFYGEGALKLKVFSYIIKRYGAMFVRLKGNGGHPQYFHVHWLRCVQIKFAYYSQLNCDNDRFKIENEGWLIRFSVALLLLLWDVPCRRDLINFTIFWVGRPSLANNTISIRKIFLIFSKLLYLKTNITV